MIIGVIDNGYHMRHFVYFIERGTKKSGFYYL